MEYQTIDEKNAQILNRWSVFDLREILTEDLAAATEKLIERAESPAIVEQGVSSGLIEFFIVESGANIYEVRRFFDFCFCSCPSYFYTQKPCIHIALTFPPVCAKCGLRAAGRHGAMCGSCEMANSPYLKPSTNKKPEIVGGYRI